MKISSFKMELTVKNHKMLTPYPTGTTNISYAKLGTTVNICNAV